MEFDLVSGPESTHQLYANRALLKSRRVFKKADVSQLLPRLTSDKLLAKRSTTRSLFHLKAVKQFMKSITFIFIHKSPNA